MKTYRLILVLVALTACARTHRGGPSSDRMSAAARAGVLGAWDAEAPSYFDRDREVLNIFDHSVLVSRTCHGWGRSSTVDITVPARVSGTDLEILAPGHQVSVAGQVPCEVKIDAGRLAFQVRRDTLVFTPAVGSPYVYGHRRKLTAATATASTQTHRATRTLTAAVAAQNFNNLMYLWAQSSGARSGGSRAPVVARAVRGK